MNVVLKLKTKSEPLAAVVLPQPPNIGDQIGILGDQSYRVVARQWMCGKSNRIEPYIVALVSPCEDI